MQEIINKYQSVKPEEVKHWFKVTQVDEFPVDGGACVKYKDKQIAVFNFQRLNQWYACQNLCPHKLEMVLSRGLLGVEKGEPKVACPLHKRTFSLKTGKNLNSDLDDIAVYPVKIEDGFVYVGFAD